MIEYLFKAKNDKKDNNDWVYGSLDNTDHQFPRIMYCDENYNIHSVGVKPETICQYTNKNDKNGKKIFSGDILEFDFDDIGKQKAVVYYNKEHTSFLLKPLANFSFATMNEGVVVGNIHDKPKIIKRRK